MFAVESYASVRLFVFVEGNSQREAAKVRHLCRLRQHSVSAGSPSVAQRTYGLTIVRI